MSSVHDELRQPWIKLCFLYWSNNIVEYHQYISVRPLLLPYRQLFQLLVLWLHDLMVSNLLLPCSIIRIVCLLRSHIIEQFLFLCTKDRITKRVRECKLTSRISHHNPARKCPPTCHWLFILCWPVSSVSKYFLFLLFINLLKSIKKPIEWELWSDILHLYFNSHLCMRRRYQQYIVKLLVIHLRIEYQLF